MFNVSQNCSWERTANEYRIINVKTKTKPSNKNTSRAYSWRNKARSKNPIRSSTEHNQTITFPAGETRPKEVSLPQLVFLSPQPLGALGKHRGGNVLLRAQGSDNTEMGQPQNKGEKVSNRTNHTYVNTS